MSKSDSEKEIIAETIKFVKSELENDYSGHDWQHVYRVWQMARYIAQHHEQVDALVVELAALLHDVADWKFYQGDDSKGPEIARQCLLRQKIDHKLVDRVAAIIQEISFKGAYVNDRCSTLEGKIVQDADRLDAIGAIGIARVFAYGGYKNQPIYDGSKPKLHHSFEEYKKQSTTSVNHFYEKLLLLKDRMNTDIAKKIAQHRHNFLCSYLDQFFKEWDVELDNGLQ